MVGLSLLALIALVFLALDLPARGPDQPAAPIWLFILGFAVMPFCIAGSWYAAGRFDRLWGRVMTESFPEPTRWDRFWSTPPEKEMSEWFHSGTRVPVAPGFVPPPSELVQALTLLRFGRVLAAWSHRVTRGLFAAFLLLGGCAVLLATITFGPLEPADGLIFYIFGGGSLLVLLGSIWFFESAERSIAPLDVKFASLGGAEAWLENAFWARY
jgi:hypothetical protein